MNVFQKCRYTGDAVPLYLPQQLFLKPLAKISITVQLPDKLIGKTISNWELMEKIRSLIEPEQFTMLNIAKSTLEYIKFEAEIDDQKKIEKILTLLHNQLIKLKEFNHLFKIKAFESRQEFPNQHIWNSFFREAKDMNEMKPGERPDTIHISNLPIRWFIPNHPTDEDTKPSEKIFRRIFEKFGRIRHVDIPICDPYRKEMKSYMSGLQMFSFDEKDFFEGYIQFKDYNGFVKAMDEFRGMKLLRKDVDAFESYSVTIKVDFDRTKHMSECSIKRRQVVRERLMKRRRKLEESEAKEREKITKRQEVERKKELELKKEKEIRRREREERRKAKILAQLKDNGADEINQKIAKEEKKLLKAQRKLEAIRLVEELFRRIKVKREDDLTPLEKTKGHISELMKYKSTSEKELQNQRDKLHRTIESRVVLKTILGDTAHSKKRRGSSSSDASLSLDESDRGKIATVPQNMPPMNPSWFGPPQNGFFPYLAPVYPAIRENYPYYPYPPRGRGFRGPGPSRGYRGRNNHPYRGRNNRNQYHYDPAVQDEYYRYFSKFLRRESRSRSRSRSHSRSRSRSGNYSRSRRSRSYSKSRSYSRSRSHSRNCSRSSRSHRSRNRSSKSHSGDRNRSSKSRSKDRRRKSTSRESVDSSRFLSPNRLKKRNMDGRRSRSRTPPVKE